MIYDRYLSLVNGISRVFGIRLKKPEKFFSLERFRKDIESLESVVRDLPE
jgi:hypothetical protein